MKKRSYLCIDFKSFYASVECVERGLDPLTTNLVVADPERSEKTICLAVSPSLKKLGIPGRCRVFELPKNIEYIMAPPRMQLYIDYSAEIYGIYLKYIAKEDIYVYSIDEAFFDITDYLDMYHLSEKELAQTILRDIRKSMGVTATCGIGTNLYLAKIALDIKAKHAPDFIGVLDEESYQKELWEHTPLTDFWRVGRGIEKRLHSMGIYTMKELAHAEEELLYRSFGIDAELMIDHAWGRETTTMADIKAYRPKNNSLSSGQVLPRDYEFEEGCLIVKEMTDLLCLELVDKGLVTQTVHLHVGYSNRLGTEPVGGTISLRTATSSAKTMLPYVEKLYRNLVNPRMPIRRVNLTFVNVVEEVYQQYDLFYDVQALEKEKAMQKAMLEIKRKFGNNAILKGMNLEAGATTIERNRQIGGHKSGSE